MMMLLVIISPTTAMTIFISIEAATIMKMMLALTLIANDVYSNKDDDRGNDDSAGDNGRDYDDEYD